MNTLLEKFRDQLREAVLTFVWQQWSALGARATGPPAQNRVIDPEPLLLLSLEVARQDPRIFDAVVDWLAVNGKWINVLRLEALLKEDKTCSPQVLGAVAATILHHTRSPKWKNLAQRFKPQPGLEPESLFHKHGKALFLPGSAPDPTFQSYGLLRSPLRLRGASSSVFSGPVSNWTAANFFFKARALFGVNIRADVFAFLLLQGAANPTHIARELGYSQRRVQDALVDMAAAGVFEIRNTGKAKEYFLYPQGALGILEQAGLSWFDWRALSRAVIAIWRAGFALREAGLTAYVLESEQRKILREVKNDLLGAERTRPRGGRMKRAFSKKSPDLIQALANAFSE